MTTSHRPRRPAGRDLDPPATAQRPPRATPAARLRRVAHRPLRAAALLRHHPADAALRADRHQLQVRQRDRRHRPVEPARRTGRSRPGPRRGTALGPSFLRTFELAIPVALISSFIGAANGFVLSRWRFPGADVVFTLILFGMFIPYQAVMIPLGEVVNDARHRPGHPDADPRARASTASRSAR